MEHPQRRTARVDRSLRATLELPAESGAKPRHIEAEIVDLSKTGAGLLLSETLHPGIEIKITVSLPRKTESGEATITVSAHVKSISASAEEPGAIRAGVELGKLTLHNAQLWHDLVQRSRAFVV